MEILIIILVILLIALAIGGIYYYRLINGFKKLVQFEQQVKQNPNDALVKQYMQLYKKTFFPKKDAILQSRAKFYHFIRESSQVSYEVKKELRHFLESEGVNLLSVIKKETEIVEE